MYKVSLDGGSSTTHDVILGPGTFRLAWRTSERLAARKFDIRIICTVNRKNRADCLELIPKCEEIGASLVESFMSFLTSEMVKKILIGR